MNGYQQLNRVLLLATAPFLGLLIWLLAASFSVTLPSAAAGPAAGAYIPTSGAIGTSLERAGADAALIKDTIQKYFALYEQSSADAAAMLKLAVSQAPRPLQIFDDRVAASFGKPIRQASGSNSDVKLYSFQTGNYKGYALKADLKTDKAMKLALGKDKVGGSETTLSAASRYGAIAGINAGGFADDSSGRYPIGTTMLNGKYVYGFFPAKDNLSFVGLSDSRKLIGGSFSRQSELDALKPSFGASFVPALLKNGSKLDIPSPWATAPFRAPRTVIGNFRNDQILVIVTDGYDERGGSGATLAELQDKMAKVGVKDAYNLDGGGSSTLVFDGQVVNKPSDGKMRSLPTHFLFFK